MRKTLWLHNIRSIHNVGSMFRTADASGVDHIYLSGYTPHPVDRFGRARKDMEKVAIGAEKSVSWSYFGDPKSEIEQLKKEGVHVLGVEQDVRSVDLFNSRKIETESLVIAMGEEVLGMEDWQRDLCDSLVEIPMLGKKESLNVSVACGVVLYHFIDKNLR